MRIFTCTVRKELHMIQLQELAHTASDFESNTVLYIKGRIIDIKSILGLCTLMLCTGDVVEIRTSGYDEEEAMAAIQNWFCL